MPRLSAQSTMPVISAPDCDTNASRPGLGAIWQKLASRPIRGSISPRQFGPWMRRRWGLAASSIACRISPRMPALITTAARQPFAPSSAITPGMVAGGVATIARSGTSGSAGIDGKHVRPATSPPLGLTRWRGPLKPPFTRLPATIRPMLPGLSLAPTRTTERGASRYCRLRIVMGPPASSTTSRLPPQLAPAGHRPFDNPQSGPATAPHLPAAPRRGPRRPRGRSDKAPPCRRP